MIIEKDLSRSPLFVITISHIYGTFFLHLLCCSCKEGLKYLSTAEPKEFNLIQSILHYIKKIVIEEP